MRLLSFFTKFKKLFKKEISEDKLKYNNFVENVIPSLNFGDVIYAERFKSDIEKQQMGEGHETGPFVVVSFDNDKIIGAYCTSTETIKGGFEIGEDYDLFRRNKKSYATVFFMRTIDSEAFLQKSLQPLNYSDINKLKKKLCLTDKIQYDDFGLIKDLKIDVKADFEIGDVVSLGEHSYIIIKKNENDNFLILPTSNYNPHHSFVDFSKVRIDYSNAMEVEKTNFYYLNSISKTQMLIILNNYNNYKKMKDELINNKDKKLDRGCLINIFDNYYYYVYGIEGNIANTFAVERVPSDESILITGKEYSPIYDNLKDIDIKSDTYTIIGVASEQEMVQIKEERKKYKKVQKEETNKKNNSKKQIKNKRITLSIGTVVCLKRDITSKYIICNKENNVYHLISVSALLKDKKIVNDMLPKSSIKRANNITSIELKLIKRKLEELGNNDLSEEIDDEFIL